MDFTFTKQEIDFIVAVLGKQPMETVEGLVNNIRKQYMDNMKKQEEVKEDDVITAS